MRNMKVVIGCDHGGFELKEVLSAHLKDKGFDVVDVGTYDTNSVDYPDIAQKACEEVIYGRCEWGVLICGTGIGISIAANKVNGIRCALVSNEYSAEMTKRHNNANMVAFGGRVTRTDSSQLSVRVLCVIRCFLAAMPPGSPPAAPRFDRGRAGWCGRHWCRTPGG